MSGSFITDGPWFAIAATMVHTLWIGAIIGILAMASRLVLRRAGANVRYAVALAWLGLLTLAPVGTGMWVARGAGGVRGSGQVHKAEPASSLGSASALEAQTRDNISLPAMDATADERQIELPLARESVAGWLVRWRSVAAVLPAVWLIGATGMLGWSLMGLLGAERLRRGAEPAGGAIERQAEKLSRRLGVRSVGVMLCPRVVSPVLVGILRPVILLPAALATELSPSQLEMILIHELAHVRRWDNLVNLLQRLVESILFFHPAVWLISAWVRQEREHCCDDAVVLAGGTDRHEYAQVLLGINQWSGRFPAASAAGGGNLLSRIRRIITRRDSMRISRTCVIALIAPMLLSAAWLTYAAAPAGDGKTLTVTKEGGEYKTIQSAIDAAPEGAVIKVGPGRWEEGLTIKKGITLEGSGWDKTTLVAAIPEEARQAVKELSRQLDKGITMGEWKAKVDALAQKYQLPAVVRVQQAQGVTLRGFKVAGVAGPNSSGRSEAVALVVFDRSAGQIDHCAVVGSPGNGIELTGGGSDVRVTNCLVGAVWGTGIVVGSRDGQPVKATIADSDVRTCYYSGIVLGRGSDATVEGCRIWGTAWHGIRYDDVSPTIRGNRIFNVARCGIYASGDTHATITGNLFWNNEMDGVSCWFANQDTIEGNTFASNQREGLMVLGNSKPTVGHNLFVNQPAAISCSAINGQSEKAVGDPKLDGNWFWQNKTNLQKPGEKEPLKLEPGPETNSRTQEIQFTDAAKGDYSLPPNSPALAAKVGVAKPLDAASPFPSQDEEKAIAPDGDSWDYRKWKKG